jgi:hypothetical protein
MKLRYFLNRFNKNLLYQNNSYNSTKSYLIHTMIKEARIVDVEKVAVIGSGNW